MPNGYCTPWLKLRPTEPDPPLAVLVPTGRAREFLMELVRQAVTELEFEGESHASTNFKAASHGPD